MKKITQTTASTFHPKRSLAKAKSQNQFEETDPAQRDRKIIRMRNVVDLGDAQDDQKRNQKKNENEIDPLLEQLDQWHENIMSKKKTYAFEQVKQNDNHKVIEQEFNIDNGPQINQNIINQIMKPIEKQYHKSEETNEDVQVKFQMLRPSKEPGNNVLKTLDQVRIEMNKQILNSLLLQKVTKKLDTLQINRKHKSNWNIQKMDEETTQIFRDQSHALKQKTLNNFKGITEYFSNPAQYIDYDIVLTKAKHYSNRPPTSFPTTHIPQQQQNSTSAKQLMESYQLFQTQIKEHKNIQFQLRIDNNQLVQEQNHLEEEVSDLRRKFFVKEEKARQGWMPESQQTQGDGAPPKKKTLMDMIEKIRNQRDLEIKQRMKEIQFLKQQMQQNIEKQQQIQKELDDMRQKKRRCKMLLKDIFLKQFQESNNQLVPEGLVSIIKNMRKINESVKLEYFPKYLDEKSKQYLILAAQLEIDIEETRVLSQKYNSQQILLHSNLAKQTISSQRQQMNVSQIKNQVKLMLKKSKVSIKKPVFVQGIDPLNPSSFAHVIKWEHQDLEPQQMIEPTENNFKSQNMSSERNNVIKDYNQKLVQLQQQLESITNEECQRILKQYQNKKLLSDVQELKMVLYALFGQVQGDQWWIPFVMDWTEQKQLNPQQIFKNDEKQKQSNSQRDQHTLPDLMKKKVSETFRKLTEVANKFYTLIAFACVNVVCSSFIIFTYLAWKAGRKSPGDIVFALGLCQLSTSIYWMMSSPDVNTPNNPENNINDSSYCKWVDFTQNLGFLGQFVYNFAYCFTMRQEITNVLKANAKFKLLLHSFSLVFTLCISLIIFAFQPQIQHRAKQQIVDSCINTIILERNYLPLTLYVVEFIYIISALYTIWYFYQNLPNDDTFRTNKKSSLIRYVMYIISTIILSLFTMLSTFIQTSEHPSYQPANLDTVMMISTCSFYTLGSGILCYQRVKNPALLRKIVNMVHKAFYPQPKKEVEIVDVDTQFIEVQKFIRMFQIRSVLAGIIQYFNNIEEYLDNDQIEDDVEGSEENIQRTSQFVIQARTTENCDFQLNSHLIRETLSEEQIAIAKTLEKYKLNNQALNKEFNFFVKETQYTKGKNPKMFALAPKYFYYLFKFDNLDIDAHDSFSLEKNAELIENMINVDGGKSGEFFFFSYDNKWILKTITDRELNSFRQRMPEYFHHMSEYRKSLINKIYGIFSYDMNYISSSCGIIYHMVLMRNISQVPRPFVKRTFDLKGSEVAREALKGKPKDIDLSRITLKDVDFDNLEKWIKIEQSQSDFVKFQLIKDAEFFKNTYLLDYSLLIMKIDWGEYQGIVEGLVDLPQNAFPSQEEPNIYYHIAIIDYLQEWNLSKMAEKASKQLLAMNPNLNVSAQTPEIYAYRFIDNLVNKIFR